MRRFLFLFGVFLILGGAFGCIGPSGPKVLGISQPRAMITGVLLRPGEPLVTKHLIRADVRYKKDGRDKHYQALLGPLPFTAQAADAIGHFKNPSPMWFLQAGWVLLYGNDPVCETDLVIAEATGTTIIGQIEGNTHRIYLLSIKGNEQCRVKHKQIPTLEHLMTAERGDVYVEATANTLTDPQLLSGAPPALQSFVQYVRDRAGDAEIYTGT